MTRGSGNAPAVTAPTVIAPGSTIGVLGGGQLGRMIALAAAPLGYRVHVFAPETDLPAADVSHAATRADFLDVEALDAFASQVDVVTLEFENVPVPALERLRAARPVRPGPRSLDVAQHRVREKDFVMGLGGRTAPFRPVADLLGLERALAELGTPAILKTCRLGYDGKGQHRIDRPEEASAAFHALAAGRTGEADLVLEGLVPFEAEFSIILARSASGETAIHPATRNRHEGGILRESTVPAGALCEAQAEEAVALSLQLAEALDHCGVMACEFFATAEGPVFNEMAPRVHNSGHWTIEGARTSQFEQHVRAVCGLPLGSTTLRGTGATSHNLLGRDIETWGAILRDPGAHLHLYGKGDPAPGRKMGHVTHVTP